MLPRTMLQKDIEYLLKHAGIKPAVIDLTLMLVEIGEEDRLNKEDVQAISSACAQFEGDLPLPPMPICPHGFTDRARCAACAHFDEIEARERYEVSHRGSA